MKEIKEQKLGKDHKMALKYNEQSISDMNQKQGQNKRQIVDSTDEENKDLSQLGDRSLYLSAIL